MIITAFDIASRFIGLREIPGTKSNPQILGMLKLVDEWPEDDEVPWCSAFVNYIAWLLGLPQSRSLRARSWLGVGRPVLNPQVGFDIVILKRGGPNEPGPDVLDARGHVGFYAGTDVGEKIAVLGGNQDDQVRVSLYPRERVLGFRALWEE